MAMGRKAPVSSGQRHTTSTTMGNLLSGICIGEIIVEIAIAVNTGRCNSSTEAEYASPLCSLHHYSARGRQLERRPSLSNWTVLRTDMFKFINPSPTGYEQGMVVQLM